MSDHRSARRLNIMMKQIRIGKPSPGTVTPTLNSNSEGVEIYENAVWPNGISVSHDRRGHETSASVHHNDIGRGDLPAGSGLPVGIGSVGGLSHILPRVKIDANTYRGFTAGTKYWWTGTFWSAAPRSFSEWQGFGLDKNGKLLGPGTPVLPPKATAFALSPYGQQGKRSDKVSESR